MIIGLHAALIGIGATACIDLWALSLRKLFGVRSLDYCLLGRWVLHMPSGRIMHESIGAASPRAHECKVGWAAHYAIGVVFALGFVALMGNQWLTRPTLLPALLFGVATVVVPFFTLQPAFGLGVASSRVNRPFAARVKSVATHGIFGLGLYVCAVIGRWILAVSAH